MRKIRLKFPITELDGTFYEVGVHVSHQQEEETEEKPARKGRPFNREPSKGEKARWQHIREAETYAAAVQVFPHLWALYTTRAKEQRKRPEDVAFSDYLKGKNLPLK